MLVKGAKGVRHICWRAEGLSTSAPVREQEGLKLIDPVWKWCKLITFAHIIFVIMFLVEHVWIVTLQFVYKSSTDNMSGLVQIATGKTLFTKLSSTTPFGVTWPHWVNHRGIMTSVNGAFVNGSRRGVVANGIYRKISNTKRTKSPNLNVFRLVLHLSLPNPLKPGVKSRMKK